MIRWLTWIFFLTPWVLTAQTVPPSRAAEIARGVMGEQHGSLKTQPILDTLFPVGNPEQPAAFVVTFKPTGFVIVSAQETQSPVLGYSLSSAFPDDPGHPLRCWLLPVYQKINSGPSTQKSGQNLQYTTDHIVLPLTSAKWGQGAPWNRFCPVDSDGKQSLVGCVAVAMAQVMEKWQWPARGYGSVTYTPLQHPGYGNITANFDTTHYHWELTHDIFPTDQAALILYHAGVSSYMNYDPVISTTSVDRYAASALVNNFFYNPAMIFRDMEAFTDSEWIRLLHQELDNSRPVIYSGISPDGKSSHAFNIDGYRNDTYFHFNWGWNGAGDGWYTLAGMAGGGADFSSQQGALFGIQPYNIPLHDRPSAPDMLAGDKFVQLFWDQPVITDLSHFTIYRDDTIIGQTAENNFLDQEIENGKSYTYHITAYYQGEIPGESAATPDLNIIPWEKIRPEYLQTFEEGSAGWQSRGNESGFQIRPAADLQIGGNSGKVAAIRSEGHPAGEQVTDYLISPVFYPGDYSHPAISFDYVFKQNPGIDKLTLLWRDFNSRQWNTLAVLDSTGSYSDWKTLHFYIPQTSGNTPIQIAFRYNDFFGQGFGAAIDNIAVYEVAEPAIPDISIESSDLCLDQDALFTDQSEGSIQSWAWDFGETAEPRYANTPGPHWVHYTKSGNKTVKLSLNHLDHLTIPNALMVREKPVAGFDFLRQSREVIFTNKSNHAEKLLWLFGDGSTSGELNPRHTYVTKQFFEVRQIAYNGTCTPDTATVIINMNSSTGVELNDISAGFAIYPNPTSGRVTISWDNEMQNPVKVLVLSMTGQQLLNKEFLAQKSLTIDLFDFPDGLYILQVTCGRWIRREQVVKLNN